MVAVRSLVYIVIAAASCTSCAGIQPTPPVVPVVAGSESVSVFEEGAVIPSNCTFVTYLHSEDGIVNSGPVRYDGTLERALQKVRNLAVRFGANVVVKSEVLESLELPGSGTGSAVQVYGVGYKCPE
jgi:hypothetical protein